MRHTRTWSLPALILIIFFTSCNSEDSWKSREKQQISDYLLTVPDSVENLKPSGLYYFLLQNGSGTSPVTNDTAYFKYVGRFLNGIAFDSVSTVTQPYKYVIGSLSIVKGVDEGLRYMKPGGRAILLTPSDLAYGRAGVYNIIPGYTPLLWFIELDSVVVHRK